MIGLRAPCRCGYRGNSLAWELPRCLSSMCEGITHSAETVLGEGTDCAKCVCSAERVSGGVPGDPVPSSVGRQIGHHFVATKQFENSRCCAVSIHRLLVGYLIVCVCVPRSFDNVWDGSANSQYVTEGWQW